MKKRIISIVFSLLMIITAVVLPTSVSAKSKKSAKTKAMTAYRSYLAANVNTIKKFSAVYLDNNSVPELFIVNDDNYAELYIYRKGKVKNIYANLASYFWQGKIKYYKKTGILDTVNIKNGIETCGSSKFYGTSFDPKIYNTMGLEGSSIKPRYYKLNKKGSTEISKSAYNSVKKKLTKGKKASTVKFYKNTKQNRKKYLK